MPDPSAFLVFSIPAEDLSRIEFVQQAGDIQISSEASPGMASFRGQKVDWSDDWCTFQTNHFEERASVRVVRKAGLGPSCMVHWELVIPAAADFDFEVGQGSMNLHDHSGNITGRVGNGDLDLAALTGSLDLQLGQGQIAGTIHPSRLEIQLNQGGIHLDGLLKPAQVQGGIANVALAWLVPPEGKTWVRIGTGAIDLTMPEGTTVHADVRGVGKKRVENLDQDPNARVQLEAVTGMGKITVHSPE